MGSLVAARFDARARELGLTRAQWRVLAQLRRREGINQTALAEMAYQLGPTGLLEFKTMLAAIADHRWADAAAAGRKSLWYRQTTARAERVLKMIETGTAEAADAIR